MDSNCNLTIAPPIIYVIAINFYELLYFIESTRDNMIHSAKESGIIMFNCSYARTLVVIATYVCCIYVCEAESRDNDW